MRKGKQEITQECLFAEYESVYRYVLSLCRNETEAQDITQETFLRAMSGLKGFKGGSTLYTWLCTIARNFWIDRYRKLHREYTPEAWEEYTADQGKSMEESVIDRDLSMRIHRILHTLQEPYKEVFSLRIFGQLSFTDIAELFSKSESWARVTYHRAKKMISEIMQREGML